MQNRIFSFENPKKLKDFDALGYSAGYVNQKTYKARALGYLNAIHYMAPASLSGFNLCPKASAGCKALCLGWTSGQAGMVPANAPNKINTVRQSRIDKARRFMKDRKAYMVDLVRAIELAAAKAQRAGMLLCVRLNGSTDVAWEGIGCERFGIKRRNVFEAFPAVQFVDYTKLPGRFKRALPHNYHLTLSRSETNERECIAALAAGVNVAVVFAGDLPEQWNGYMVVDGDKHDLRHLDPKGGVVIGLSPKGRVAKRDTSGFVVR
jgi:hypothetical protein